jgi:hypothetical protein
MLKMEGKLRCPCKNNCGGRRDPVVNSVLKKEFCTTVNLRAMLQDDLGDYTLRKGMNFLISGGCQYVTAFKVANEKKFTVFGRQGKLLYLKDLSEKTLKQEIYSLLSNLQRRIVGKFSAMSTEVYCLSLYDIKRLIPAPGSVIEYSINRLIKLDIIKKVTLGQTEFFVLAVQIGKIEADRETILISSLVEFVTVKTVHELIMNLYPVRVISGFFDVIRPQTRENLTLTGGMSFDIFYRFREGAMDRKFLAIDVYTRYPVTGYTVNSFMKKIEWAKTREKGKTTNYLAGNTYGMIVFRSATPGAIRKANSLGIRFIRLKDIKIDYSSIYDKVKADFVKKI